MHDLSNKDGSISYGETSWEAGDTSTASSRKVFFQDLINKANSVPLIIVFNHYGLRINDTHRAAICPFKSHKDGRESTPSFRYYKDTNSFFCYGCSVGGKHCHAVEFVALFEGLTKAKAAYKILSVFKNNVSEENFIDDEVYSEQFEIMMDFSNSVRQFRQYYNSDKAFEYIENISLAFDNMISNHELENEALKRIVERLKEKITDFKD